MKRFPLVLAALLSASFVFAEGPAISSPDGDVPAPALASLRHAVACPPFKGPAEIASLYRDELIRLLNKCPRVEFLDGPKALSRNAPAYLYHIVGEVSADRDGSPSISIRLVDAARKETLASFSAPVSTNRSALAKWCRTIQRDMTRRAQAVPFECEVSQQTDQGSLILDRGLSSGLCPGMVLYVVQRETSIISHESGQEIGRDTPRALGQIKVYRVKENSAYARPLPGTVIPRSRRIYAREF